MTTWTPTRVRTLKMMWAEGKSAMEIAHALGGVTRNAVIGKVYRLGIAGTKKQRPVRRLPSPPRNVLTDPRPEFVYKPTARTADRRPGDQSRRRHVNLVPDPGQVRDLRSDHPALAEGRSIFPTTPVDQSPRVLVDGHNNRKIGRRVEKGRWAGMPIYTLTLEERATCPRSCPLWDGCFGNAMHHARRHEHGPLLEDVLTVEVMQLSNRHPEGFVVRLHVLGDFYSVEYVELWGKLLERFKPLQIWGYTAYLPDAEDEGERAIGLAIAGLRRRHNDRFAVRFSGVETEVFTDPDDFTDGLICPAEQSERASCGTCAFCWERTEKIGFVKHGMRRTEARRTRHAA